MNEVSFYLTEGRRVFSVCPRCGAVHRLSELALAKRGEHETDWLDELRGQRQGLEGTLAGLEEQRKGMVAEARRRAEVEELPQLLRRAAPAFDGTSIDPRDVRILFHPVEFAVFEGMNSGDGVRGVTLLHLGRGGALVEGIGAAVERGNVGWRTIRVDDDGNVRVDATRAR